MYTTFHNLPGHGAHAHAARHNELNFTDANNQVQEGHAAESEAPHKFRLEKCEICTGEI